MESELEPPVAQTVQPAQSIEINLPSTPWYETQAVAFVLGALVSLLLLLLREYLERRRRSESLLVALHGEVNSIRAYLRRNVDTLTKCIDRNTRVKRYDLSIHKVVFAANAGNLGDLRDAELVRQVVNFYEFLGRIDETARRIQDGTYPEEDAWPEYVNEVAGALHLGTLVEVKLAERTKHIKVREIKEYRLSEQDTSDRNVADRLQKWAREHGQLQ